MYQGQYTEDEKTDWIKAENKPVYEGCMKSKPEKSAFTSCKWIGLRMVG
jgi:hypothetical protein